MTRRSLELWGALAIVYVVWGSTYLAIKVAVRTLPPLLAAGTRFLAASAVLALVLVLAGRSLRVPRRQALASAAVGAALLAGGVGLVHVAETRIDSSVAAMIAGSVPLQVVIWRLAGGERVQRATVIAAVVGLGGLALVIGPDGIGGGSVAVGLLVMLVGTVSWSSGSYASTRLELPESPFVGATYQMLGGALVLLAAGVVIGEAGGLERGVFEAGPVAAWAYLCVAGSVVGFSAYVWLLDNAPISQVVTHQYVNPLVAIALGAVFLDERPGLAALVGAVLIVGAVVVTARYEGRRTPTAPEPTPRLASVAPRGTRAGPSA